MTGDLTGDKTDAANVCIAIFFAEAEPLRKMRAHDVPIEHRCLAAVLEQLDRENLSRS